MLQDTVTRRIVILAISQVRQQYGVKKDLLGLLEGRETYVIGKDGTVKMVSITASHLI